ncbi:protein BatD [Cellulophaga sp. E16_2]|uniref:Aerotolerance-related exported protein n=1 Tax=Cellulophaga algicola (strain DSM 14237 / IC166 / ACAM 630) TaxID=688270 RepID=E6X7A8_CELAD|nr:MULTISPECIES: BatD family protein [Cellulophaga]ADV48561.1 aerotolerance-related exported protein [Cellulophaga algicola DSM 14237]MBO0590979.1 protein BatD [Cellulophaga sp. E16_2]
MVFTLKKYIALLTLMFLTFSVKAQEDEVTFEMAVSKEKLGLNERLRVDFTINRDGDNFNPPNFEGFRVVMGPAQSIRNSWINGVRSYSKSYSYTLMPTEKGTFTIGQSSIIVDGKVYKSLTKKIEVSAAVEDPNAPPTAESIADDNLHLVAEVSNNNPYLNEAVSVVYKLYVSNSIRVTNFRPLDSPKYNNFWSQDMPVKQYSAQEGTFQGKPYQYVILKRIVLYPQKTGKLDIEPLSLDVSVEVPTSRRDFFGRPLYTSTHKTVSAGSRTLNVKELPLTGKPENFTGAVGKFDFSVTTSKKALNASESLQASVKVSGSGNLKLFQLPEPSLPSALEVYEPEFDELIKTTITGMEGSVKNNYTIVPSYKGKYPIPSIAFSYFDPKAEKYISIASKEIVINVIEGPTNGGVSGSTTPSNRQEVVSTGSQFLFIKLSTTLQPKGNNYFYGSTAYLLWLLLPLILIPLAILFGKKREAIRGDVEGNKVKKANKLSRKYLSAAKKTLGNKEAFYVALEKALHNYLKAKLKIETSEFSKDKIAQLFEEKQVNQSTTDGFMALLKNCEMARYSPFSNVQMQEDYNTASEVISSMDKQL